MKKTAFIILTVILIVACGEIVTESKAIIKNQEGLEFLDKAEYSSAIKSFKQAIENPKLSIETKAVIYRNIAQTYYEMMEIDSSLIYSKLAAECYPKDSYEYLTNISDIKISSGETEEAEKLLLKAVKMKPNELAANNTLGAIYLGEFGIEFFDPEKALPYNLKAFEINNDRITEDVLGRNYLELGNYAKARSHYMKLHKEYPDIEVLAYQLGVIEYLDGDSEKAEIYFNKVIAKNPDHKFAIDAFKETNE
ncbi:tetratricopeptide repeat protein [Zobellia galactanivorans]|uniref:tetratricopeptide repeat protein n=1 Tax=Zobellia galactanivorans (strain DSM 12802 / CCUG 47099 / CIP 106680 / NCIMB 13871 / Dsij) TaxID=63186 RepID=UPI001C07789E|nr:tetratricopeptide repeat protein [Zobellia galactanivorans]MBU3027578.1 tetratricopeptide repeat protein [Zobellia galactanivorans]